MASKAAAYVKDAIDTEEVLGAVRDVASVRMEHAHHHSAGSLASVISGNQFILHPSSLIAFNTGDEPPEFKERLVGKMMVMVLSVGPTHVLQRHHGGEHFYVRAGCVLPVGVATGRWSRHHSSAKAVGRYHGGAYDREAEVGVNEGFEVYLHEYEEKKTHTKVYPRISFSVRTKKRGVLGGSKAISEIVTLNYESFWEGPGISQVLKHTVPFPRTYGRNEGLHLVVALAYEPVQAEMAHKGAAEAAMNQQVRSTYEAKAAMKALTPEQLAQGVGAREEMGRR